MSKKREQSQESQPIEASAEKPKEGDAPATAETEGLEQRLEAAQAEIEALKDKLLRAHAEMDNVRKRAQREVEQASRFAIERFAAALLDVVDNLERALAVEEGREAGLREGVRLTLDGWHEVMRKFGMERIDALGQMFDPHLHEALAQVPHEKEPSGKVVAQHVAGYTLHGRLLRPAKVIVSSGPPKDTAKERAE